MRKVLFLPFAVLVSYLLVNNLGATEVPITITGRILKAEPSKSITVEIGKSKGLELSFDEIKTLAVLDPKRLTDGVGTAAAVGGAGGAVAAGVSAVNPPKGLQGSNVRNAGLVGVVVAALSALARGGYNYLTMKQPMLIFDADNESLNNVAVIYNLPVGTKVKITQKNHINGTH